MTQLLLISGAAGFAIVIGSLVAVGAGRSFEASGVLLGAAGGSMLALTIVELVPRSIEFAGGLATAAGVATGFTLFFVLHGSHSESHGSHSQRRFLPVGLSVSLPLALGLSAHNLLEGLGMGAIYHADPALGWVVGAAVAVHNLPLGFALVNEGGGASLSGVAITALVLAALQPLGAVTGALASVHSSPAYAFALSASAGLLIGVAGFELLPRSTRSGIVRGIGGLVIGLGLIVALHLVHGPH